MVLLEMADVHLRHNLLALLGWRLIPMETFTLPILETTVYP